MTVQTPITQPDRTLLRLDSLLFFDHEHVDCVAAKPPVADACRSVFTIDQGDKS